MRQVPFSRYTGATWEDVIKSCEYLPGDGVEGKHAPCINTVTHLDCAGRRVTRPCYLHPGDVIVIVSEDDEQTILWMDYVGELVQLVRGE